MSFVPAPANRAARRKVLRYLRQKRGLAAVTAALLLVPAALAGDTVPGWSADDRSLTPVANGLGRGFFGIDLEDLGASGQLPEVDGLSDELLRLAGDPNALASGGDPINTPTGALMIPGKALEAYKKAADMVNVTHRTCNMHWSLLASIARIESNHGRGQYDAKGNTIERILGPVLNGGAFAAIQDTDGGVLDGDRSWDRAVGPFQFIPGTWKGYASDADGDRVANPHNMFDAALSAAKYLCSGDLNMSNDQQRAIAVFRYNHSNSYVSTVLIWAKAYESGVTPMTGGTGGTGVTIDPNAQAAPAQTPIATTPPPTSTTTPPPATSTTNPPVETTVTPKPPLPSNPPSNPSTTRPSPSVPSNPSTTTPSTSCEPTPTTTSSTSAPNTPSGSDAQQPSTGTSPAAAGADSGEEEDPCKPE
ncbi:lytic transglycosylase domain-containing protein [Kibdelosporangium aridum]|uniref:Membrane-bound lytic murein transglycosylase B n=1 Tax=Kibdelosporangium aridum TaxID=2030 RepID=A0A1Y5XSH5_KIBAR|nr:lytic murein transglycosylase [Kibdelosporangium aridum]SMD15079.1 Membrane-bound lytic murein transglycosylase B [Kibdelosporangium aridum]